MLRTMRAALTLVAAGVLGLVPLAASAQITPGTELIGTMDQNLSSNNVQVGQRFTMHNVHSQSNDLHDAVIYGHVAEVQAAGQGRPGKILLTYDKLHTNAGNSYAISARTNNVQVNTKNNTLKEAGGAVAGMIVGNVLGKAIGTNIGGLVGAAGGYVLAKNNRENVSIPQGATVNLTVTRAYRQAG